MIGKVGVKINIYTKREEEGKGRKEEKKKKPQERPA